MEKPAAKSGAKSSKSTKPTEPAEALEAAEALEDSEDTEIELEAESESSSDSKRSSETKQDSDADSEPKKSPKSKRHVESPETTELLDIIDRLSEVGTASADAYNAYSDGEISFDEANERIREDQLDMYQIRRDLRALAAKFGDSGALLLMLYLDLREENRRIDETFTDLIKLALDNGEDI